MFDDVWFQFRFDVLEVVLGWVILLSGMWFSWFGGFDFEQCGGFGMSCIVQWGWVVLGGQWILVYEKVGLIDEVFVEVEFCQFILFCIV